MAWSDFGISQQAFVINPDQMNDNTGRQVDWANVPIGYVDSVTGKKRIPAGKAMKVGPVPPLMIPIAAAADAGVVGLLKTEAYEDNESHSLSGYGLYVGGGVYENLLPDQVAGALPAALKTSLQALGAGFYFGAYEDSSAV